MLFAHMVCTFSMQLQLLTACPCLLLLTRIGHAQEPEQLERYLDLKLNLASAAPDSPIVPLRSQASALTIAQSFAGPQSCLWEGRNLHILPACGMLR